MLRSSLARLIEGLDPKVVVEEVLLKAGIEPTARPESIDIAGFLAIARSMPKSAEG